MFIYAAVSCGLQIQKKLESSWSQNHFVDEEAKVMKLDHKAI